MDQIQLQWLGFCKCLGTIGFFLFFWYNGIIPFFLSKCTFFKESIINKIRNYLISKWAKSKTAPSRTWYIFCGFVFIAIFAIKVGALLPILIFSFVIYYLLRFLIVGLE